VGRPAASAWRTILLVEDRDECRISTKWFLTNLGYTVDGVRSGPEALVLFHPGIHDAVIIGDATPGMTYTELAHIVKLRSPSTPVIVYAAQPVKDGSCIDLVLQSPTHLLVLKEAVESLLAKLHPTGTPPASEA
jgi:CheY-like chemotaxis protein